MPVSAIAMNSPLSSHEEIDSACGKMAILGDRGPGNLEGWGSSGYSVERRGDRNLGWQSSGVRLPVAAKLVQGLTKVMMLPAADAVSRGFLRVVAGWDRRGSARRTT